MTRERRRRLGSAASFGAFWPATSPFPPAAPWGGAVIGRERLAAAFQALSRVEASVVPPVGGPHLGFGEEEEGTGTLVVVVVFLAGLYCALDALSAGLDDDAGDDEGAGNDKEDEEDDTADPTGGDEAGYWDPDGTNDGRNPGWW